MALKNIVKKAANTVAKSKTGGARTTPTATTGTTRNKSAESKIASGVARAVKKKI